MVGAELFNNSLIAAKTTSPDGGKGLVIRGAPAYVGKILYGIFNTERNQLVAGGAVIDGEIASLFRNFDTSKENGVTFPVLPILLPILVKNGGKHLVCQAEHLGRYISNGFQPTMICRPTDGQPEKYFLCVSDLTKNKIATVSNYDKAKKLQKLITNNQVEKEEIVLQN